MLALFPDSANLYPVNRTTRETKTTKQQTPFNMNNAQNNTLGLNSNLVSAILTIADNLRGQYNKLGATAHQLPRNPYPMHKLVINALPTSKSKALTRYQLRSAIEAAGYRVADKTRPDGASKGQDYVSVTLARLVKSGAVQFTGTHKFRKYWFAL